MIALPIFASFINWALEFERRHQLTEKAVQGAGQVANTTGTSLIKLSQTDLGGLARHVLQDVLAGARDGVSDYAVRSTANQSKLI